MATPHDLEPLRVGILGAGRITLESLVPQARDGLVRLVAIAARDRDRAAEYAAANGVERVVGSYPELVHDDEVEVVYNPLPNGLHGPWNLAAAAAGKHVFSEKPFASNAEEAQAVVDAAAGAGVVVLNAFHYRYHPVFDRLLDLIANRDIGELVRLDIAMRMPAPADDDPRWSLSLAGGALMDLGCYCLSVAQSVSTALGGSPRVLSATAGERPGRPGVDEWLDARLELPGGIPAIAFCNMADPTWDLSVTAVGSTATVRIPNFVKVNTDDRLIWLDGDGETTAVEHLGTRSSYHYQIDALTAAIREGRPILTDGADAVANMRLIDDCYRAARLAPRPVHLG